MASSLASSFFAQWGSMIQPPKSVQYHTLPGKCPEPWEHRSSSAPTQMPRWDRSSAGGRATFEAAPTAVCLPKVMPPGSAGQAFLSGQVKGKPRAA